MKGERNVSAINVHIDRILCPIDFSEFSRDALDHAVALARWYGSTITVMHVLPLQMVPVPEGGVAVEMAALPASVDPQSVVGELREFATPSVGGSGIGVEAVVKIGLPAAEINRQADGMKADLLVLGTHGRSGFQRLFLGSVTERVLRSTNIPVLTIPPPVRKPDSVRFKTILCPMDFSDESIRALEYALSLAKEADARIILLHVIEGTVDDPDETQFRDLKVFEYYGRLEEAARARLAAAIPDDARIWAHPVESIARGKAYRQILRVAEEESAELIVMGIRGRGAINRLLFGSNTAHVIREATCPVLTLNR
jgi:nucleotide-binding universal stress UspA family protein